MAAGKKDTNKEAIDWFVVFITKVCPGMLEVIGGGPAGPGGPGSILSKATPAQKKAILSGVKKIAELSLKIQKRA
jgi:hypothetical protein